MTALRIQEQPDEVTAEFVAAMAGAATQVTIVSTNGPAGKFGVTVSAFSSVSAEPPMVLVCINRRSPAVEGIEANGGFCVNILGEDQSDLANCFAGRPGSRTPYEFVADDWDMSGAGCPKLRSASAIFDCTIESSYDAGTHRIFVGKVFEARSSAQPSLAFSRRAYQVLSPLERNSAA